MRKKPELKEAYVERIKEILGDEKAFEEYIKSLDSVPVRSFRCNTLKISPEDLRKRLDKKGWKISQPWKNYPEVFVLDGVLEPGELGRSLEHLLGYYYIQDLASMLPVIALKPEPNESILDLCAAPGSKTTQIAARMKNTGVVFANEVSLGRLKILASNLERCGVVNAIITKKEGFALCNQFNKRGVRFDKILIDAPCSGEGTLRSNPKTALMWNPNTIRQLSRIQKDLISSAFEILNVGGEILYSTCTHAPEENEEILDFALEEFGDQIEIEKIDLPVKIREGMTNWKDKEYKQEVVDSCRVYPQDNNTEGFFLAKIKKIK